MQWQSSLLMDKEQKLSWMFKVKCIALNQTAANDWRRVCACVWVGWDLVALVHLWPGLIERRHGGRLVGGDLYWRGRESNVGGRFWDFCVRRWTRDRCTSFARPFISTTDKDNDQKEDGAKWWTPQVSNLRIKLKFKGKKSKFAATGGECRVALVVPCCRAHWVLGFANASRASDARLICASHLHSQLTWCVVWLSYLEIQHSLIVKRAGWTSDICASAQFQLCHSSKRQQLPPVALLVTKPHCKVQFHRLVLECWRCANAIQHSSLIFMCPLYSLQVYFRHNIST